MDWLRTTRWPASKTCCLMGVAEGCTLLRDIPQDQAITYDDVVLPEGRLVDQLRREQEAYFSPGKASSTQLATESNTANT